MKNDERIIDVPDEAMPDDRPQDVPQFSIRKVKGMPDAEGPQAVVTVKKRGNHLFAALMIIAAIMVMAVCVAVGYLYFSHKSNRDINSSVSDSENLEILSSAPNATAKGTHMISDSVLGVAFEMYSLEGLHASLETAVPDTADNSLVLFMRTADYHPDGSIEGSFVLNGERLKSKSRNERRGYVAVSAAGVPVIGISSSDKVAERMADSRGGFFRQYVLLGDGRLPVDFHLHGKVERSAIGRMADGSLHYITTRHKETMYDFADALREYGVVDAIYITGGNSYDFHRTPYGQAYVSDNVREKMAKYSSTPLPAPLLVFRSKD